MRKLTIVALVVVAAAAVAAHADEKKKGARTCGEMTAAQANVPAEMAAVLRAMADGYEAHATIMQTSEHRDAKAEIDGLKDIATELRDTAGTLDKAAEEMKKAASWPGVPHDMEKMKKDERAKASREALADATKRLADALKAAK